LLFSLKTHRYIYLAGLFLLATSLPLSVFGMSLSQLIFAGNWLLEGDFKNKFNAFRKRKEVWIFISIYIVHILWLFPPQDYQYALNDLRIKVPLLVLPFLIATSKPLQQINIKNILQVFTLSVFVGSIISLVIFIRSYSSNIINYRELSVFISHIRFSLMVVMSIFILLYYSFICKVLTPRRIEKNISILLILWMIVFLVLLKALTGLVVFTVVSYFALLFFSLKLKHYKKWIFIPLLIIAPFFPAIYIFNVLQKFTNIENLDYSRVDKKTVLGNEYSFLPNDLNVENGHLVWAFYCEKELQKEWSKKSFLNFNGKDKNGNELKYTLVRYLTSKGLRKDSLAFSKLSKTDIEAIENGVPNYIFLSEWKIYPIVYNAIWELYEYKNSQNAEGHSITQRIEYLKTAKGIINKNLWFGVGTGNVQQSFNKEYYETNSKLSEKSRLRAHNQFITFLITFGVFGFIWILFAIFYPYIKWKGYHNFLFTVFLAIALLSFINEDTLETQAGVTFFVFFYTLFLFSKEKSVAHTEQ
jgi:hypothetical protein